MKKKITITVIVTILVALTGAIIWLFPGANDTVRDGKRDSLCEVTRDVETTTATTTTTTASYYRGSRDGSFIGFGQFVSLD